jgi:hypothetical protein
MIGGPMKTEPELSKSHSDQLIHITESWNLNHWCEELNLRAEELLEIVKRVGPKIEDIKEYLKKRRPLSGPSH